jgi:hypothetical protein
VRRRRSSAAQQRSQLRIPNPFTITGACNVFAAPSDDDLIHWHTTLLTADLAAAWAALRAGRAGFVSPDVVALSDPRLGIARALLARDPDGHAVQVASE